MRSEVFKANTIDEAARRILKELKEDTDDIASSRHNMIYFDGWDGLGASAVLQAVRQHLSPAAQQEEEPSGRKAIIVDGPEFSQILHLDCSKWVSRRAMQRNLAEQLELPASAMEMFDTQDEIDDFNGKDQGSRFEIPQVASAIYQHIQKLNGRFLVIFHNGSTEEIDLDSLGFPLSGYSRNKAVWSFQGRFRVYPRTKVDMALKDTRTTDIFLSATTFSPNKQSNAMPYFLRQEALELASQISIGGIDMVAEAINCFLCMMQACRMGNQLINYDLATHGFNYWKCDGIKQLQDGINDDKLWIYYDAVQQEMRFNIDSYQVPYLQAPGIWNLRELPYWTSPSYGIMLIPEEYGGRVPKSLFQQFDKLCVLKLSKCVFSFETPPFLCCHNLRFLWLDQCRTTSTDETKNEEDICRFFQNLWVLDIRYSNNVSSFLSPNVVGFMIQLKEFILRGVSIDMDFLQGQLHNVRKLQVTECNCKGTESSETWLSEKDKIELLEFSENYTRWNMTRLYVGSSCRNLVTVIIHSSVGLREIWLKGCTKLKNLFLIGSFPDLYSLVLTQAAVEALDLSAVTAAPMLNELILLDCWKLYSMKWPSTENKTKGYPDRLCIDYTKEGTARPRSSADFCWYFSGRERLLGLLLPVKNYFIPNNSYLEISTVSSVTSTTEDATDTKDGGIKGNRMQQKDNATYADIFNIYDTIVQQQLVSEADCDALAMEIMVPPFPPLKKPYPGCLMHIEDHDKKKKVHIEDETKAKLQSGCITIPGFICDSAKTLHAHDGFFFTCILGASTWSLLEWCRVEQCPKLESVFSLEFDAGAEGSSKIIDIFQKLKTIWGSLLTNARYILDWSVLIFPRVRAFANLTRLHLYCCPRLVYAIPLQIGLLALESLETIEITWCSDLTTIFHIYVPNQASGLEGSKWWFPNLKHIHLHELPKLRGIFDIPWEWMMAPKLESVKIRGCWSLRKLLYSVRKGTVKCDCEKEWWDRLEQYDRRVVANQYKLTHPRYYKKTMPRGRLLR